MPNWDKLNKKFENVLNNITDESWDKWIANRKQNKIKRRTAIINSVKIK